MEEVETMLIIEAWIDAEVEYSVTTRARKNSAIIREFQRCIAEAIENDNDQIVIKLYEETPIFSIQRLDGESDEALYERAEIIAADYEIKSTDGMRDDAYPIIDEDENICYVFASEDVGVSDNYVYCETWCCQDRDKQN